MTISTGTDEFYQYSDNEFRTAVKSVDGSTLEDNTAFSDAEYIIADRQGNVVLRLTLGSGITRDNVGGKDFITFIDDGALTFSGAYMHQFVVYDLDGNKLPPVFIKKLKILPTYRYTGA